MKNIIYPICILLLSISFFACTEKKPLPTPIVVVSNIKKFSINMPPDFAIILDSNKVVPKQSSISADFSFNNLAISPEYKSLVRENALYMWPAVLSDGMFNEIKDSTSFSNIISQTTFLPDNAILDINMPTAPYALANKYYLITNKNYKKALLRIDNYTAGVQHNLQATVIMYLH